MRKRKIKGDQCRFRGASILISGLALHIKFEPENSESE
jgi:hypothetical protein